MRTWQEHVEKVEQRAGDLRKMGPHKGSHEALVNVYAELSLIRYMMQADPCLDNPSTPGQRAADMSIREGDRGFALGEDTP